MGSLGRGGWPANEERRANDAIIGEELWTHYSFCLNIASARIAQMFEVHANGTMRMVGSAV